MSSRPPRLRQFDYTGAWRYLLTTCPFNRQPVFVDAAAAAYARDEFLRTADRYECEVLAYCFMPDHVHLLVGGRSPDADIRVNNPVRAELVERPDQYPHWGSGVFSRQQVLESLAAECRT